MVYIIVSKACVNHSFFPFVTKMEIMDEICKNSRQSLVQPDTRLSP